MGPVAAGHSAEVAFWIPEVRSQQHRKEGGQPCTQGMHEGRSGRSWQSPRRKPADGRCNRHQEAESLGRPDADPKHSLGELCLLALPQFRREISGINKSQTQNFQVGKIVKQLRNKNIVFGCPIAPQKGLSQVFEQIQGNILVVPSFPRFVVPSFRRSIFPSFC